MPRRRTPDDLASSVGGRVRRLREEAGLTLEGLASEVSEKYSKGHLSSLERGLVMPTVATLKVLADALGVLVADLVIDPEGSDRERIVELTRSLGPGALKKLVKELSEVKPRRRRPSI